MSAMGACSEMHEYHQGPVEMDVDDSVPPTLYDSCAACGCVWDVGAISEERADQMRRARGPSPRGGRRL